MSMYDLCYLGLFCWSIWAKITCTKTQQGPVKFESCAKIVVCTGSWSWYYYSNGAASSAELIALSANRSNRSAAEQITRWRHQMETFSALLALCGDFTDHRWIPFAKASDAELWCLFSDLRPNKRLSKQSRFRWFEMPSRSLWRYCNEIDRIVSRIDWSTLSKIDRTRQEWMDGIDFLTHWGRATHICDSKLTIIASDNGLSPGRRQAIIWANAGIVLIGPLGTNFSEILIEIQIFSYMKMHLKMSSAKWRPFCLGLNVF